ncbi:MAG: ribosomal small subunit methyltransferase [Dehalococcoidia bacterium]|nr:ribosomal small subunit methyltransferase [Dehalococcoidia bacterium]
MRVLGGAVRGHSLLSTKGKGLRPTTSKVRKALFDMLEQVAQSWDRALDLYAGTGSLGIEALSRGAEWVDFVDSNPQHCHIIRSNLQRLGLEDRTGVRCQSLPGALKGLSGSYDIVLMDPPYAQNTGIEIIRELIRLALVKEGAVIAFEHGRRGSITEEQPFLKLHRERNYGDTHLSIYTIGG